MRRLAWQEIRKALRRQDTPPPPTAPEVFWTQFRARAAQVRRPQPAAAPARQRFRAPPLMKVAWAAATLTLAGLAVLSLRREPMPGSPTTNEHPSHALAPIASAIEEIEVFVPYSSVMIMQDAESGSAIVWLADLELSAEL